MAILKFNKAELVNLEYSLKREILGANGNGSYFNTSIIACNTRKYHGLLVVPVEKLGGGKYVLLSAIDDSIVLNGKQFNLGIHCYGDIYEPKGHKYIVDFNADTIPVITYKVGPVTLTKSFLLSPDKDQVFVCYDILSAPGKVSLVLKPFLAFRGIHGLTEENSAADTSFAEIANGASFGMYGGFPALNIQSSLKCEYRHQPYWYKGVTYSDEYRRGFDCREDLLVPGSFTIDLKTGSRLVISASTEAVDSRTLKKNFEKLCGQVPGIGSHKDMLMSNASQLKVYKGGRKVINAGYSWLEAGLLRETVEALPGLTLYADGNCAEFEEILDNLITAESERLFRRTTQIEAPLALTDTIQQYIEFSGKEKAIWKKYGKTLKAVIESYDGAREEARLSPNGLLWCQKTGAALTWMNTYLNGWPVNERAGFQVEVNAMWYNALCFALEMEGKYGAGKDGFIEKWAPIRDLVKANYQKTFVVANRGYYTLCDYVDNAGQHKECRPNMMWAASIPYQLIDDQVLADVVNTINNELVTRRGIRTLSPRDINYKSVYEGSQNSRDLASHNGSTRPALLGPWVNLCFRLMGPSFRTRAKWLTEGFFEDANKHGVGSFSEMYDADPPHEPHGAINSACSTAALMRCLYLMDKYSKEDIK